MSISDMIVVMKEGVVQQIGKPQVVYDDPVNLFVSKFLGTPPINVFEGVVKGGRLFIGDEGVLDVPGAPDGDAWAGKITARRIRRSLPAATCAGGPPWWCGPLRRAGSAPERWTKRWKATRICEGGT